MTVECAEFVCVPLRECFKIEGNLSFPIITALSPFTFDILFYKL